MAALSSHIKQGGNAEPSTKVRAGTLAVPEALVAGDIVLRAGGGKGSFGAFLVERCHVRRTVSNK